MHAAFALPAAPNGRHNTGPRHVYCRLYPSIHRHLDRRAHRAASPMRHHRTDLQRDRRRDRRQPQRGDRENSSAGAVDGAARGCAGGKLPSSRQPPAGSVAAPNAQARLPGNPDGGELIVLGNAVESAHPCALTELAERTCRWPLGDPMAADFAYCGNDAITGFTYCVGHARMAYRSARPPQRLNGRYGFSRRRRRCVPACRNRADYDRG